MVVAGALMVVISVTVLVMVTSVEVDVALLALAGSLTTAVAVGDGVEDGGLPDTNVYAVLTGPTVTVEVVVVNTVEVRTAPGADSADAKMPLQARTVLSFMSYCA